eukprot:scaffold415_cov362-Prasinococcus_capsulatus_cf.AAC.18
MHILATVSLTGVPSLRHREAHAAQGDLFATHVGDVEAQYEGRVPSACLLHLLPETHYLRRQHHCRHTSDAAIGQAGLRLLADSLNPVTQAKPGYIHTWRGSG